MADVFKFQPTCVEWNMRHAHILIDFLNGLEQYDIKYVILKNDLGLPFENHSKDVDIVIEPGCYKKAANLLANSFKNSGVTHYKIHKFERLRCWYGFNVDDKFAIHIDLLEGFLHKGFEIFPFEIMYSHSYKNENGIYVLDEVFANLVLLLHSTICYRMIKEKYVEKIAQEYAKSKIKIDLFICNLFPKKAAFKLISLLERNDYKTIAEQGRWFSYQSKIRIIIKRPFYTFVNVLDFFYEKFLRIILNQRQYNMFISVHAPDGTGKTTFIQILSEYLGFFYVCDANDLVKIYHFRPETLPNLGAAGEKAGIMKQDKNFTFPHRAKPAGFFSSLIRMTYYWIDYVIGMPYILRKNAQFNQITLFDRYIYDLIVDPFRSCIKLPLKLRWVFVKMVKQPQIIFVLDTDAEIIYARKQELNKEEIVRQLREFRKLKVLGNRVHILDASKTPQQIAEAAMKILLDEFAHK